MHFSALWLHSASKFVMECITVLIVSICGATYLMSCVLLNSILDSSMLWFDIFKC